MVGKKRWKLTLQEIAKKYFLDGVTKSDKAIVLVYKKHPDRLSVTGKIIAEGLMEMYSNEF